MPRAGLIGLSALGLAATVAGLFAVPAASQGGRTFWGYCKLVQFAPDQRIYSPVFELPTGQSDRYAQMRNAFYSRYKKDYADDYGCPTFNSEQIASSRRDADIAAPTRFATYHIPLPFSKTLSGVERAGSAGGKSAGGGSTGGSAASGLSAYEQAVEAEVRRLGAHRRAEAERLVALRERAADARGKIPGALSAPPPAAFVKAPNLPMTKAPRGFFDSNRFVRVSDPKAARAAFDRQYGVCSGSVQYLTSGCYPDGTGQYSCQARVRCPLNKSQKATAG